MKDKRSRYEPHTTKLFKFRGTFRKGKNIHDYKIPNNPDNNEWYNLALEDIALYWDLPNFDECKHYYFHVCDIQTGINGTDEAPAFPMTLSKDEIIDDHY